MRRRALLRAGAGLAATATTAAGAGCLGLLETRSARTPPLPEDRPAAVYFPSHVEGTAMVARTTATTEASDASGDDAGDGATDEYGVAVVYSYPHRFWTVTGAETTRHALAGDVHLMAVVWDAATGTVLPETGADVEITRDDELVSQEVIYPMLSQPMGYHHGGNFALAGDGTYTVRVSVAGTSVRRTGAFRGRLGRPATAAVEFTYSEADRDALPYEVTEDRAGSQGAVESRERPVPRSVAPEAGALPGRDLGTGRVGDAVLVGRLLETPPAGVADDGRYLLVSARTPYNRTLLPRMGLTTTVAGERRRLVRTMDPSLGYHYGTVVPGEASVGSVTVAVETPPQVARHEGYETAFLRTGSTTL